MSRIDLAHLARQTMQDDDLQCEILRIFVKQMAVKLAELDAVGSDLSSIVHSLKGSARGVGAWEVSRAVEAFEADPLHPPQRLQAVRLAVEEAVKEAEELLKP